VNTFTTAWRGLRREWQARELRAVAVALIIAVAGVVSVAAFGDRLYRALRTQGSELLGADLVVSTPQTPQKAWLEQASQRGLRTSQTLNFRSVVVAGEETHLAEVKAAAPGYPLRGTLRTRSTLSAADEVATTLPEPGTVWLDPQMLSALKLNTGAHLKLGTRKFKVARVLSFEPDRGGAVFAIAPRVLMNIDDVPSTKLVQPGSLVRYHLLVAGNAQPVQEYRQWLVRQGVAPANLRDVTNSQPRFRAALERGERFLSLATLVGVLLAGIAVARAARHYAQRQLDAAAMLRCFGASQRQIRNVYTFQLLILGLLASAIGCVLGFFGQEAFVALMPGLVAGALPAPGWLPVVIGLAVGLAASLGFGLPVILRLKDVPPLRVIRRELGALPARLLSVYFAAVVIMAIFTAALARDLRLTLWVLGIGIVSFLVLGLVGYGLVRVTGRVRGGAHAAWRLGLAQLARHRGDSVGQIVALGIGVTAVLLLTLVRSDLFAAWAASLPQNTPNHFLINIQPNQVGALEKFLNARGVEPTRMAPIVRARLLSINGQIIDPEKFTDGFARRITRRDANLSWADVLPDGNKLASGQWWNAQTADAVLSVERRYAEALRLRIGDKLRYRVGDHEIDVTIANLRTVSWDSFAPNFFLLVPPALLKDVPASFITSIFLPREQFNVLRALVDEFPNITDIDVDALLAQARRILDRVNMALQYIFLFTLAAGLVVLYTAIHAGSVERRQGLAVMRALGARRGQLVTSLLWEYWVLGLLAGLVGAFAATTAGWILSTWVFDMPFRLNAWVWVWGAAASAVIVMVSGWWGSRRVLGTPPWQVLRM